MKTEQSTVVLIYKTGGDFHFCDVSLLAARLQETWKGSRPLRILCFSDVAPQEVLELKNLTVMAMPHVWPGWWAKMNLFSPQLKQYRPFLYLDLDTAVIDNIQGVIPENDETKFITLADFYKPTRLASGVMWIPENENMDKIWDNWIKNPNSHMAQNRGDQDFIEKQIRADEFWQNRTDQIGTFKPKIGWLKERPKALSIVCFHGFPRISKAATMVAWVREYVLGILTHDEE